MVVPLSSQTSDEKAIFLGENRASCEGGCTDRVEQREEAYAAKADRTKQQPRSRAS
jgi:hypothetical protein